MRRITKAFENLRRRLNGDKGSSSAALLIILMIPGVVALIVSTALTQLFIQYQDDRKTNMVTAAETAGSYLLNGINSKLPAYYAGLSKEALASETRADIETIGAQTYVSDFSVDDHGWIQAVVVVQLESGKPQSWAVQYRPTEATVFKGFDPDSGRPLWAFTSATDDADDPNYVEPLGLYEQVPTVANVNDYPTQNIPGAKATAPQNLRVLRSETFGIVLAWDKPLNASEAGVAGYRIDATKNAECIDLDPDTGFEVLADGYVELDEDWMSTDIPSWRCSSDNTSNIISVRARGNKGLGIAAYINLSGLPTYDLDNLVPEAPTGLAYNKVGSNSILTWDEQTCNFGYGIQFRIKKTTENGAYGNFGVIDDWDYYTASGGKYSFVMPPGSVLAGSTQGWVVEGRCVHNTFGASTASDPSNEANTTTTIDVVPTAVLTVSQTDASGGTASWSTESGCPVNTAAQYRLVYTKKDGVDGTTVINNWATGYTSKAVDTALGTSAAVRLEARCFQDNGGSPIYSETITSDKSWTFDVTPNTSNLSLTGTTLGTASWNVANNCPAGTVAQYRLSYLIKDGVANTSLLRDFAANYQSRLVPNSLGTSARVQLQTRCAEGTYYSTQSTLNSNTLAYIVPAPAGTFTARSNNVNSATAVRGLTCAYGTIEYRAVKTRDGSTYSSWPGAWTTSNVATFAAPYEGYAAAVMMEARCNNSGTYSSSITSNTINFTRAYVSTPSVPWMTSCGSNCFTVNWGAATCPAGSTINYHPWITRQNNSGSSADGGWIGNRTSWTRPSLTVGGYIYWHVVPMCSTSWLSITGPQKDLNSPATSS